MLENSVLWLGHEAAAYAAALASLARAASSIAAHGPDAALDGLRVEYARLFTGPGRPAVMCYASQYLDADGRKAGRLNGPAAAIASAAYAAEGVAASPERGELADHVTTELEFLYHLCRREERAWAADDTDEALRLRRSLDGFLREHASLWLTPFAAAVGAAAGLDAYEGMAELLAAHLAVELGEHVVDDARRRGR